jgi:hypothetical protein
MPNKQYTLNRMAIFGCNVSRRPAPLTIVSLTRRARLGTYAVKNVA